MESRYGQVGYNQALWDQAVEEGRAILVERAARRSNQTIAYSDLAAAIKAIHFDAQHHAFHDLLGDISVFEEREGRGMITVLVVHKGGDQMPGVGFFQLAESLGRDVSDKLAFWSKEFQDVLAAHRPRR